MKTKNIIIQALLLLSLSVFANANDQQTSNTKNKSYGGLELGYLSEQAFFAHITSWRSVKPWFDFGMGIGVRYNSYWGKTVIPVFLDLKAGIPDKKLSPYLSAKAGYALGGGVLVSPKFGLSIKNTNNKAINLGLGYEMQQTGNSYYSQRIENSVLLSVGLTW